MAEASMGPTSSTISADAKAAMLLVSGPMTWMERLTDRLNPIFVKEGRQSLRSKTFVIAFLLLVFTGWFISAIGVLSNIGSLDYGDAGREMFQWYFGVLAVAITLVVPFGAFRSLITERDEYTFEPLVITSLSPRQIVVGKLMTAMLQAFLFYSAIAPFMAFTSLLNGFDMAYAVFLLVFGLLYSLLISSASLAIGSLVHGRVWQTIVSLVILGGLLFALGMEFGFAFGSGFERQLNDSDFWLGFGAVSLGAVSYIILLQQIAIINLTFEADNRSTGMRVIAFGQFAIFWIIGYGIAGLWPTSFGGGSISWSDIAEIGMVLGTLHWSILGLPMVTERNDLSVRVQTSLPRLSLFRLFVTPFLPGGMRGLILVLGSVGLLWLMVRHGLMMSTYPYDLNSFVDILCLYLAVHAMVASLLAQGMYFFWPSMKPSHVRAGVVVVFLLMWMLPLFVVAYFESQRAYNVFSMLYVTSPFIAMDAMGSNASRMTMLTLELLVWGGIMLACCLWPMFLALLEVVNAPIRTTRNDRDLTNSNDPNSAMFDEDHDMAES
ncbi:MAG: hypothetical protein R3C01_17675 [Planctomycetaceae bacterium]